MTPNIYPIFNLLEGPHVSCWTMPEELHDSGQQLGPRQESRWGSSIDGTAEARGLVLDQQLITMNIYK